MRFGADLPLPMGIDRGLFGVLSRWRDVLLSNQRTRTETDDYELQQHDHTARMDTTDAALTVTLLPAEIVEGKVYAVKNVGAATNDVTIDAYEDEEIDGATTLVLTDGQSVILQSNGTGWDILAEKT